MELVDVMYNTSVDIIKSRMMSLDAGKEVMGKQIGRGKDIMSILCEIPGYSLYASAIDIITIVLANEKAETRDKLSNEEVVAQIS